MYRLTLATIVVAALAASAAACPPVAVQSYGVQVQSGCFAPAVAVQSYSIPNVVAVQAVPVHVQAVQVKAFAHPSVRVQVNQRRFFGRLFGPRVSVRVR